MNIVVDLEHTISNASHRIAMKKTGIVKHEFQKEFINDTPNINVIMFMNQLRDNGNFILILTAKEERYRLMVRNWLQLHGAEYDDLIMKLDNLFLPTEVFKEKIIQSYEKKIDFALDDVGKNCAMFARNNIPCLRIVQ